MNATMRKWTTSKRPPSLAKHGTTLPKLTPEEMTRRSGGGGRDHRRPARRGARPFIALLHNPELAGHVQQLGEHLRWKGKLPARLKELAVL